MLENFNYNITADEEKVKVTLPSNKVLEQEKRNKRKSKVFNIKVNIKL